MEPSTNGDLKRVIGARSLALNAINLTIGSSIFVVPAIVSGKLGGAAMLGYIACGIMFLFIVLCYIEVASRVQQSGGSYAYVETAFGPFAGFIVNSIFVVGWDIISDAAILNLVTDSLATIYPVFSNSLVKAALFFAILALLTFINVRGSKQGVLFTDVVTIVKLTPLFLLIVFGWGFVSMDNLRWEQMPTASTLGDVSIFLFFLFAGFETPLNTGSEIKNPKRTIPVALFIAMSVIVVFYVAIQQVALGVLGAHMQEYKDAPLAGVAQTMIGPIGATLVVFVTAFSCFGGLSGDILASPRLLYAGAKNGQYPKFLCRIHPRFQTPYWSVIIYTSLIFVFAISGGFKQLVILGSGALLLVYLSVVLSMIKLRLKNEVSDEKTFRVPGGMIIPVLAIICIVWVLAHLKLNEALSIAIFIAVMSVFYLARKMLKKEVGTEKWKPWRQKRLL